MSYEVTSQYLEMKVQTATPETLVVMLYEGAIKFLNQATHAMSANDWHKAHTGIVKAQNIVAELNMSLDKKRGGDIAENLSKIYGYLNDRLIDANVKKDPKTINECISLLNDLNSAWHDVTKNVRTSAHGVGVSLAG